jgi:hypothetical protein
MHGYNNMTQGWKNYPIFLLLRCKFKFLGGQLEGEHRAHQVIDLGNTKEARAGKNQ